MKMEPIVSSETSAIRTQTPGNYPKRNKLHLEHGESLKTRLVTECLRDGYKPYLSNFNFVKFKNTFDDNHRSYGYKIRQKCVLFFVSSALNISTNCLKNIYIYFYNRQLSCDLNKNISRYEKKSSIHVLQTPKFRTCSLLEKRI